MKHAQRLLPLVVFITMLVAYMMTLAPGLTWANRGADGGDLITAAATGGVPHPTGYPLYILLARLFQLLPFGSLAFRTNLLSALAAAGASALVCQLVTQALPTRNSFAGMTAGAAFGLSSLLWSQAVITEVYTLNAFLVVLLLYWSLFPPFVESLKSDLAFGVTFGLALGNHLTTTLLLPILLMSSIAIREKRWQVNLRGLFYRLGGMGLGLLVYLVLPLRAFSQPPVNWGNPLTLDGFLWLVSGRLYQDEILGLSLPFLWERIRSALGFLLAQYGVPGLALSLAGWMVFSRSSRLRLYTTWMSLAYFVFTVIYATEDSFLYLIQPAICLAVWMGFGVDGLMEWLQKRSSKLGWAAGFLVLVWVILLARGTWSEVDASQDARAEQFGELVMLQMPRDALVFARGDQVIFSLWYFHFALHQRPDIAVIAMDMLHFEWYTETLRSTYPSLSVPGPFPFPDTLAAANPERPVCIVEYGGQADIRCP